MKRIILLMMMCFAMGSISFAQTEVKVKHTSTVPQRVHNTFSRHKRHNGVMVKTKSRHHKRKHKMTNKVDRIKHD
ncbi:MAG: hypothetical protein ABJA78_16265 [Ferruginibacter sp.]